MSNPTISGAPLGHNGIFSVRKYGSKTVMITDIQYTVTIGTRESSAAHSQTLYPLNEFISSFDISVVFKTYEEREALNKWLRTYMNRVSSNQAIGGYVYVYCPARKFVLDGVLVGNLMYGDSQPADMGYPVTYRFTGARNPISIVGTRTTLGDVSTFKPAISDKQEAPYFYPSGTQKAGATDVAGTIYDVTPPPQVIPKPKPTPIPAPRPRSGGGTPHQNPGGGFVPV